MLAIKLRIIHCRLEPVMEKEIPNVQCGFRVGQRIKDIAADS